ncbi:DUF3857 domain-containing protein [Parabacteroides bouchesdurhonensis]|uniref:DUF3857 domain-containing protein n=1 Tax=Parabacteroides bouchesdurhonensis TaxID=1936995 RepID=UPI000C817C79|nr:DUF3857 domain-containing protein [Parabacteroides bouchesdurhonensis]
MTKITNKILLLLSLLTITISVFAASEAEYGKLTKAWTLHADGSQEFRCSKELTLLTPVAIHKLYGESFIVYNPEYQELKINSSYTKQKDGTIVKTPDNAFVEVLPNFATDAPAYNKLKEMVVVHTGLEPDATIYLDYTIITKPGYYPALDIDEKLQETSPVKEYSVMISVPEDKAIQYQLYGSNAQASEVTQNGAKEISWTLKNIPAGSRDAFMPENGNDIPRLAATTYPSLKDALSTLGKRFNESMDYESKTFAQYITEQAANDQEKLEIIHNHVVNNLGYSGVAPDNTGYTIRDVDNVLREAYGTYAEKTQLLNTMLNAAGIKAEVVTLYPGTLNTGICGLKPMKKMFVKTSLNGEDQYLSAVSMTTAPLSNRGELDKLYNMNGEELPVAATPVIIKETKEVTIDTSNANNGYAICKLPPLAKGVDRWNMSTLNSSRTSLFEIPSMINEEVIYIIKPSGGLRLKTPVNQKVISKPFGKITNTVTPKGDVIEVVRTIELNKQQFSPAEYKDLRMLINEWNDPNNRVLLFSDK